MSEVIDVMDLVDCLSVKPRGWRRGAGGFSPTAGDRRAGGGVGGDTGEHIGQLVLRIDVIHLGGGDQAVHGGSAPRSDPQKSRSMCWFKG
jgi:hypothetical protein